MTGCWLAKNGVHERGAMPPCDGRLRKCHLIAKQEMRRRKMALRDQWDPRVWVWGCGGVAGNGGHHGMLDHSRTLRIPRDRLPPALEEFARDHDLVWWLTREYGE